MPPTKKGRRGPRTRGRGGGKGHGPGRGYPGRVLDNERPESATDVVSEAEAVSEEGI